MGRAVPSASRVTALAASAPTVDCRSPSTAEALPTRSPREPIAAAVAFGRTSPLDETPAAIAAARTTGPASARAATTSTRYESTPATTPTRSASRTPIAREEPAVRLRGGDDAERVRAGDEPEPLRAHPGELHEDERCPGHAREHGGLAGAAREREPEEPPVAQRGARSQRLAQPARHGRVRRAALRERERHEAQEDEPDGRQHHEEGPPARRRGKTAAGERREDRRRAHDEEAPRVQRRRVAVRAAVAHDGA